jgi:ankyrin repeat protein
METFFTSGRVGTTHASAISCSLSSRNHSLHSFGIGNTDTSKAGNGYTPLISAARRGCEAVITLLLEIGKADVEAKAGDGCTALILAVKNGHEAVVKLLQTAISS